MWLAIRNGVFTQFLYFQLTSLDTDETTRTITKTKEETIKRVKEPILIDEIANQDVENKAKKVKNLEEAVEVVNDMQKIIRSNNCFILWLAYQQGKIFEIFKTNNKFINLANNLGISKSTMALDIPIAKFLNKYPKMKKSSLSLRFLKHNLKIFEEICHENAVEFKQSYNFLANIIILKSFKK